MKIIDKSKEKDEEEYKDGDVIVAYDDNDDSDKQYFLLVRINSVDDESRPYEAIALNETDAANVGTDESTCLSGYNYESYSDLIEDLKEDYDHVERVQNPRLLVGGDDDD